MKAPPILHFLLLLVYLTSAAQGDGQSRSESIMRGFANDPNFFNLPRPNSAGVDDSQDSYDGDESSQPSHSMHTPVKRRGKKKQKYLARIRRRETSRQEKWNPYVNPGNTYLFVTQTHALTYPFAVC